ncbi:MAG: hypothetical protein AB7V48_10960 [Sedimentibacter sp.]
MINDDKINILITESKQVMDQVLAESYKDRDIKNFIEIEKKKYKKTDDIDDILNK